MLLPQLYRTTLEYLLTQSKIIFSTWNPLDLPRLVRWMCHDQTFTHLHAQRWKGSRPCPETRGERKGIPGEGSGHRGLAATERVGVAVAANVCKAVSLLPSPRAVELPQGHSCNFIHTRLPLQQWWATYKESVFPSSFALRSLPSTGRESSC
jgi:hypothetical protein